MPAKILTVIASISHGLSVACLALWKCLPILSPSIAHRLAWGTLLFLGTAFITAFGGGLRRIVARTKSPLARLRLRGELLAAELSVCLMMLLAMNFIGQ